MAMAPVALIACATAVHSSAGTLALLGGLLRIGLVHYNTLDEVDRLVEALREL